MMHKALTINRICIRVLTSKEKDDAIYFFHDGIEYRVGSQIINDYKEPHAASGTLDS